MGAFIIILVVAVRRFFLDAHGWIEIHPAPMITFGDGVAIVSGDLKPAATCGSALSTLDC